MNYRPTSPGCENTSLVLTCTLKYDTILSRYILRADYSGGKTRIETISVVFAVPGKCKNDERMVRKKNQLFVSS